MLTYVQDNEKKLEPMAYFFLGVILDGTGTMHRR